jgi:hypothetical protein
MFKKIIAERAAYHNSIIVKCNDIITKAAGTSAQIEAAYENRACARACLAELIIVENQMSVLSYLEK